MNAKGALISVMCIALVAMTAGAGTLAYFSDTETSTGNTFTAGTLDLKISDGEDWGDGVTATWTLSDMKPGDSVSGWVVLDTVGSIAADHAEITCDYSVTEESPQTESDTDPNTDQHPGWMAKNLTIDQAWYQADGYNINLLTGKNVLTGEQHDYWKIEDVDGDGKRTLYDLKYGNGGNGVDNLPPPDTFQYSFSMNIKFNETAGNDFQGDTFNLTVIFTLNQDGSQ
ncbi:hypothetical protein DRN97_11865 [Methanosarcinales archaeon]|nr:MAG: hypothetical protein DRN97_11865 [Methanosarcinales archaeon]